MSTNIDLLSAADPVTNEAVYTLRLDDGQLRMVLLVPEVADLLRVSNDVVYSLIRQGLLRVRNLHPGSRNSRYLIPVSALIEYLRGSDDPIPSID